MTCARDGQHTHQKTQKSLSIAIPASLTEDTPHLREKTYKIGLIGRACSIFRVEQVIIYFDKSSPRQAQDAELTASILRYMDTPQYLRKALISIEPRLQFVGILPPLRAPHHQLTGERRDLRLGMLRQGVVVGTRGNSSLIDIGVGESAVVQEVLPKKHKITVRVTNLDNGIQAVKVESGEIRIYWGYNVTVTELPLAESTRRMGFDLVIATSRYGKSIHEMLPELQTVWTKSQKVLLTFGSPAQGLQEILARQGSDLNSYADFTLDMIPNQGVETVRTEEAICASLSLLNILR